MSDRDRRVDIHLLGLIGFSRNPSLIERGSMRSESLAIDVRHLSPKYSISPCNARSLSVTMILGREKREHGDQRWTGI